MNFKAEYVIRCAVIAIVTTILVFIPIFIGTGIIKASKQCAAHKTITSVGGCDRYGTCGVVFQDGSSGVVSYPVVGGDSCGGYK